MLCLEIVVICWVGFEGVGQLGIILDFGSISIQVLHGKTRYQGEHSKFRQYVSTYVISCQLNTYPTAAECRGKAKALSRIKRQEKSLLVKCCISFCYELVRLIMEHLSQRVSRLNPFSLSSQLHKLEYTTVRHVHKRINLGNSNCKK